MRVLLVGHRDGDFELMERCLRMHFAARGVGTVCTRLVAGFDVTGANVARMLGVGVEFGAGGGCDYVLAWWDGSERDDTGRQLREFTRAGVDVFNLFRC